MNARKMRPDSTWNALTAEQREQLAGWLLEEMVPYRELKERIQKEFGVEASKSSLARYYRYLVKEREVDEMRELMATAEEMDSTGAKLECLRSSAWKVIGKRFLEKAIAGSDVKELAALGRLVVESEEREIQRNRVALSREKYEFKMARAVLKAAPTLKKLSKEKQDREDAELDEARLAIFGNPPPGYEDPALDALSKEEPL